MARRGVAAMVALVAASMMLSCVEAAPPEVLERSARYRETVSLAAPEQLPSSAVTHILTERRSQRDFSSDPVPFETLGQLFWAAQGVTDTRGHRTAPSAGARYPLEIYAVTSVETLHYLPEAHAVEIGENTTGIEALARSAFGQDWIASAPAILVITGVVDRTAAEYGGVATRLMDREAGHAAQNILLEATAIGLASVPVGGFEPAELTRALALAPDEEVLYLIPIGWPA